MRFLLVSLVHLSILWAEVASQKQNEKLYTLKESEVNPAIEQLDKVLTRPGVKEIIDNAQYKTEPASDEMRANNPWFKKGFRWSSLSEPKDDSTTAWEPEGITTSSDTGYVNNVAYFNTDLVLVSWVDIRNATGRASTPSQGIRVSIVRKGSSEPNVARRAYIHVLLVEPFIEDDGNPNFRPLDNVKTGGLVWRGNYLYITDDQLGLRVFDLDHAYEVLAGGIVGRDEEGKYRGGDSNYVIPQARTYSMMFDKNVTFLPNSLALDRNSTPPALMVGESAPEAPIDKNSTFVRWQLDGDTHLLQTKLEKADKGKEVNVSTAMWAWETNVNNAEGLTFSSSLGANIIVCNGGERDLNARSGLMKWFPGSYATEYNEVLPPTAQNVAYKPDGEELWVVGGLAGKRYVLAFDAELRNQTGLVPPPNPTTTNPDAANTSEPSPTAFQGIRLAVGAIAGIAVGAAVAVFGAALAVYLCLRRRALVAQSREGGQLRDAVCLKPELASVESTPRHVQEWTGPEVVNGTHGGEWARFEMDSKEIPAELPPLPVPRKDWYG